MPPRRVIICDRSRHDAALLGRALTHDGDIEVAGVCDDAQNLRTTLAATSADVVVMDLEHAGLARTIRACPVPVLVVSSGVSESSERTVAALAAGAREALPKDRLRLRDPAGADAALLRRTVKRLAALHPDPARKRPRTRAAVRARMPPPGREVAAIGICASTGGPGVLQEILSALPAGFAVPVLVVQHISVGFLAGLVDLLDGQIAVPVRIAQDGASLKPGVWFAPEGTHLALDQDRRLALDDRTVTGLHRPSADVLLGSLASVLGRRAAAVVLTGMGRDGSAGAAAVAAAGGVVLTQDPDTASAYGMPRAAAEIGAVVLSTTQIADTLRQLRLVGTSQ